MYYIYVMLKHCVENLICEQYQAGLSAKRITLIADCTLDTVYKVLKRRGIQTNNLRIENLVIQKYDSGLNAIEIANQLGCCKNTVYNLLEKKNIKRRPRELCLRKYNLDVNFFNKIDSEEKAYWLGFVTADGGIVNSRMTVKLSSRDRNHLVKLANSLKTNQPIYDIEGERKGKVHKSSYLCINSKTIVDDLKRYGITPNKSLKEKYYNCGRELQRHYMRGLFDGDGSIGKLKYGFKITMCGSESLIFDFHNHLSSELNVVSQKIRCQKGLNYLTFGKKQCVRLILDYFYRGSTINLERKFMQQQEVGI